MEIYKRTLVVVLLPLLLFLAGHSFAYEEYFENGFSSNLINIGDIPWQIVSPGYEGASSSVITDGTSSSRSVLQTTTIAKEAGSLSFWYKTDNASNNFYFYVDGIQHQLVLDSHGWVQFVYPAELSKGSHILRWEYEVEAGNSGSASIDNIVGPAEDIILYNSISYSDQCLETRNRTWVGDFRGLTDGLTRDNFMVRVNDVEISDYDLIASLPTPVSTSLVLDDSRSLEEVDRRNVEAAALGFVNLMANGDQTEVIKFSEEIVEVAEFTDIKMELYNAILEPSTPGTVTKLYDAILKGIDNVSEQNNKKAVIVFTDGEDNDSSHSLQDVINRATQKSVAIYTVGLGESVDDNDLRRIAEMTGGNYFKTDTSITLHSIYKAIKGDLSENYTISIDNIEYPLAKSPDAKISISTFFGDQESEAISTGEGCVYSPILLLSVPAYTKKRSE